MNTRYTAGIWPAKAPFWASFLLIKMILITSATGRGQSFDLAGSYRCVGNGQAATVYQPSGEPGLFDVDFVELTLKTRGDLIELTLLKEFGSDPTPGYQLVTNPKLGPGTESGCGDVCDGWRSNGNRLQSDWQDKRGRYL
jgi:hypothetical protein